MPKIEYNRDNLVVDQIYWLHPADQRVMGLSRQVRIMDHEAQQVNLYPILGGTIKVQAPLAHVQEMASRDAAFQQKLHNVPKEELKTELQWFTHHLQGLKAQIVGDHIVTDYPLRVLNSGSVQVYIQSTGQTNYYNVFRDLFMVWHVMRNQNNRLVWVCSLKDRGGWEVTRI